MGRSKGIYRNQQLEEGVVSNFGLCPVGVDLFGPKILTENRADVAEHKIGQSANRPLTVVRQRGGTRRYHAAETDSNVFKLLLIYPSFKRTFYTFYFSSAFISRFKKATRYKITYLTTMRPII